VQNTTGLVVLDEFIREFGHAPIYGSWRGRGDRRIEFY
jgi:hypothetical protein